MSAEQTLDQLLENLDPRLDPTSYVFCSVAKTANLTLSATTPLATFQEDESVSLVLTEEQAVRHKLDGGPVLRRITLGVQSSFEVVGLSAAVTNCLTKLGIGANVVAAFHHDHIFVPAERAEEALSALQNLG